MAEEQKKPRLTELEMAKLAFSDASINLEIAQGQFNQAKQRLVQFLRRPPMPMPRPKPAPEKPEGPKDPAKPEGGENAGQKENAQEKKD